MRRLCFGWVHSGGPDHPASNRLVELSSLKSVENIGKKAELIRWLRDRTSRVPRSFVLTTETYEDYLHNPEGVLEQISISIEDHLDQQRKYAVRSSSTLEDHARSSYAGQFKSLIDLKGTEQIVRAIREVFDSARAANVDSYRERIADTRGDVQMAVLIQEMVTPVVSGVAVSRNPLTGLNEIMVEAVRGSGEALVQDGLTPDHWVYKWGRFTQSPKAPILPERRVEQIVKETQRLGNEFGTPVDIEWVFDGENIYWVQIRPLTGLDTINIYSNTISREMLPGLIKPLIWSVNVPLVNTAWINLFEELVGPTGLKPDQLAKSFYYHAYFNMGVVGQIFELLGFPRDSLELLMGFEKAEGMPTYRPSIKTLRVLPRVIWFLVKLPGYRKRLHHDFEAVQAAYREFETLDFSSLSERELLDAYEQLYAFNLRLAYHNILVPLSMSVYNGLLSRQLRKHDVDPLDFDLQQNLDELAALDPNIPLNRLKRLYDALPEKDQDSLRKHRLQPTNPSPELIHLIGELESFIATFGHFSESGNDFSSTPWREDPGHVIEMVRRHSTAASANKVALQDLDLGPLSRLVLGWWADRTRRFLHERERVSSAYTYGYGLFRNLFIHLGDKLVEREALEDREDIFMLSLGEVEQIVRSEVDIQSYREMIDRRKREMQIAAGVILPDLFYGEEVPPIEAFSSDLSALHGMPTSRGYYEGKVTVIESLIEAGKLEKGDVLVVPYSDVAWTPLFGLAGAVIAQSGGVLSHSSIVAREMGIPCVVSVANACQLEDGTMVVVDGHRGEITIKE